MTKKHFEAIARILNSQLPYNNVDAVSLADIANDLADYFESVNPNFDRTLFIDAVHA
jgi:hypothetical protein